MPTLEIEAHHPLREFDLDVELKLGPGCVAVVGPSGAGKTSLLRVVAGLLSPQRGRVVCAGDVWLDRASKVDVAPDQRSCGFLFQDYALFPHLKAWENVAFGLKGLDRTQRRDRAHRLLDRLGVDRLADARPRELSGGERQRVALARAVAREPAVLLLDEPLAALDARTAASALRMLTEVIAAAAVPVLVVTHDFATAAQLGNEIAVLDRGRIVQRNTPARLAASPASAFVADLTGASVLVGRAEQQPDGMTTVELEQGGSVVSTDAARGEVAASVFPWEVELQLQGSSHPGSARNRLAARVDSVTQLGNRVRVGLETPQHLVAEVTPAAARDLGLVAGMRVDAIWKATATRLTPL